MGQNQRSATEEMRGVCFEMLGYFESTSLNT